MFKGISWGEFGLALSCLYLLYYAGLITLYYRAEVQALFQGKRVAPSPVATPPAARSLVAPAAAILPVPPVVPAVVEAAPAITEPVNEAPSTEASAAAEDTLINVEDLVGFLDQVQTGQFDPDPSAEAAPPSLENTVLLQEVFARSLTKRRLQLAELDA